MRADGEIKRKVRYLQVHGIGKYVTGKLFVNAKRDTSIVKLALSATDVAVREHDDSPKRTKRSALGLPLCW